VFGLLGIPLGIQRVRTIRFTSFTIGLGVMLFYYVLSKALESLGEKGLLNPVLAVWGTDILMAALGVTMFYKAAKDSPVKSLAWLEEKKDAALVIIKAALLRSKG
ncbi:MAG: LptF/LptG family permease, partial [Deltaproteobacteria bacterium]